MTSYCLPDSQGDTQANLIETTDKPYTLIAPRLSATQDPTLIQFIETHFDALCPHLNWFTVELFFNVASPADWPILIGTLRAGSVRRKSLKTFPDLRVSPRSS